MTGDLFHAIPTPEVAVYGCVPSFQLHQFPCLTGAPLVRVLEVVFLNRGLALNLSQV